MSVTLEYFDHDRLMKGLGPVFKEISSPGDVPSRPPGPEPALVAETEPEPVEAVPEPAEPTEDDEEARARRKRPKARRFD